MRLPRCTFLRRQPNLSGCRARPPTSVSSMSLFVLAVILAVCVAGSLFTVVHAKDCITRGPNSMIAWKYEDGSFQCDNCIGAHAVGVSSGTVRRRWTEYDKDRNILNSFVEEHREGKKLVLHDESRGMSILLRSDLSGIRTEGEQTFRQLYSGAFISVVDCT
ncbi:conserved hypothetical protein [Leishmania major strain Friedlin]|uniref:Uncharacterized protein n=1 Tax=Leishmania major TaxID=5664 RepID=Q4QC63_LEIMA|nr:conserved hypothetical protein [Leishmania major strain Friedlin]CAG9573535.1 hypothetical_protein_-_conserved [Leishmania major strain Friedlin]CAJ04751.1 conserved hypothetical protein [Leishmania major strain Friedlin]|eukprot:XP_001683085.1 conserved hypothetical protein [Leishmania major strain Friedlin]